MLFTCETGHEKYLLEYRRTLPLVTLPSLQRTQRALITMVITLAAPRISAGKAFYIAAGKLHTAPVSTISVCGQTNYNTFKVNRGLTTKSSLYILCLVFPMLYK
jgi:hypothetical protein